MAVLETVEQVKAALAGILKINGDRVDILDEQKLRSGLIDDLIFSAVLSDDSDVCLVCQWLIRQCGAALGAYPASIQSFYEAMGRKEIKGFTVPAINIRTLTYETAQAILRAAMKGQVGPVIFEIARSEIDYTMQRPAEYTSEIGRASCRERV